MTGVPQMIGLAAGAVTACCTLPGTIELLLVTSGTAVRRESKPGVAYKDFRLAVVIPAHNEEFHIERCVSSVLASADGQANGTVVVVADNCSDATAACARRAGAEVLVRENQQVRGKGHALRYAFEQLGDASFDGFLIVDADTVVSLNLVRETVSKLRAGADAVQARYRVADISSSLRKRLMDVGLLAFNVLRPRGRYGWGLSAGITGNGFALSRQTLRDVPYTADSIVEDLEYHLLLLSSGKRVSFTDQATVYGDIPEDRAALSTQRARWEGGRLRMAREWVPKLVRKIGHGNICMVEPLLDLLTLPLAYQVIAGLLLCAIPDGLFRWYGAAMLSVIVLHVATAVMLGEKPLASVAALAATPFYIIWKLTTLRAIFRSSGRKAEWIRTHRESGTAQELAEDV